MTFQAEPTFHPAWKNELHEDYLVCKVPNDQHLWLGDKQITHLAAAGKSIYAAVGDVALAKIADAQEVVKQSFALVELNHLFQILNGNSLVELKEVGPDDQYFLAALTGKYPHGKFQLLYGALEDVCINMVTLEQAAGDVGAKALWKQQDHLIAPIPADP